MPTAPTHSLVSHESQELALRDVTVGYTSGDGEWVPAAMDVSLSVDRGEFAAIIGPSGCGKSTLLNAMAGLIGPEQGEIAIGGNPDAPRLGRIAYMQQRDLLLPWRTVASNARLGLELTGVDRNTAMKRVQERAVQFGLGDVLGSYPWQLSGGMRQRAALLRATLPETSVLLLDEPFGALDAITRGRLQHWLAGVLDRTNRAVLLVTHDIEESLVLADRVYVMSSGPGTIVEHVEVTLPRPRTDEVITSSEFVALKSRLMGSLSGSTPAGAI